MPEASLVLQRSTDNSCPPCSTTDLVSLQKLVAMDQQWLGSLLVGTHVIRIRIRGGGQALPIPTENCVGKSIREKMLILESLSLRGHSI